MGLPLRPAGRTVSPVLTNPMFAWADLFEALAVLLPLPGVNAHERHSVFLWSALLHRATCRDLFRVVFSRGLGGSLGWANNRYGNTDYSRGHRKHVATEGGF